MNACRREIEINRRAWNEWAAIHARGCSQYPVRRLLAGKGGWSPPLPDPLGVVRGKSILHLQCHFGMDSLHWARRGARVTGVDFSAEAIHRARDLSRASGIPARFITSDIYGLPRVLKERFAIVLTYYGVTCWLPDLDRWGRIVAQFLKPGGFLYLAELHPLRDALEFDGPRGMPRLVNSYFPRGRVRYATSGGTYAAPTARTRHRVHYGWQHSLAETVSALCDAGLTIEYLHEFPYVYCDDLAYTGRRLMRRDRRGFWHLKGSGEKFPLLFSVKARR